MAFFSSSILVFTGIFLTLFLPETKGIELMDKIEEEDTKEEQNLKENIIK